MGLFSTSHNLNLDISFKYTRLLTYYRVIGDHICFADKTIYDVQILLIHVMIFLNACIRIKRVKL